MQFGQTAFSTRPPSALPASNRRRRPRRTRCARPYEPLESRVLFADATVVFNELMYHPPGAAADDALEWVELHNQMSVDMDLSGWSLAGGVDYRIPDGTIITGGGYLVLAVDPAALQQASGYAGALGPYAGRLSNAGEEVELRSNTNRLMDSIDYGDTGEWPVGPDGGGVTLAKRDPGTPSARADHWTVSGQPGGTPGSTNFPPGGGPVRENLLIVGADAKAFVPPNGNLGSTWTTPTFNDSTWTAGRTGVGFGPLAPPLLPAAYYTLNDTANDASGNGRHGALRNGAAYNADAPAGAGAGNTKSVRLDGVNDSFVTGNLRPAFDDESVTISVWFKARQGGFGGVVVDERGDPNATGPWHDSQVEVATNGEVRVRLWNLGAVSLGTASFGQWHHAVLRYDGGSDRLDGFLDGVEATADSGGDREYSWDYDNSLGLYYHLGNDDSTNLGNGRFFDGLVDELSVFNTPLNNEQIAALAAGGSPMSVRRESGPTIAYDYLVGAAGTQEHTGPLGHDFRVSAAGPITVTKLGVFDSGADGLQRPLTAQIWQINGQTKLAELQFTPADPGTLFHSNRFKPLPAPLVLQPGDYTVVAYGYGPGERNGNVNTGGPHGSHKAVNSGGGQISFVGRSRYATNPGEFPTNPDLSDPVAYSAGTFEFGTGFSGLVGTDVSGSMRNVSASAYVRTEFDVADPSAYDTLSLRMRHDDGFVAYLNGTEVARRNAPTAQGTPPAWNAAATAGQPGFGDDTIDISAHLGALSVGENVLAVHGLNVSAADADFLVLPEISATRAPAPRLALNEIAAGGAAGFFVELINHGNTTLPLGGYIVSTSAGVGGVQYVLPAQSLVAGGRLVLNAAQLGFTPADGDKVFLHSPNRGRLLDAAAVRTAARGRSGPEGTGPLYFVTTPTPGTANAVQLRDQIVINEIMYRHRPEPAIPPTVEQRNLVEMTAAWKYNQDGVDLGTDWRQVGYNDAAWASGPALLYVEDADLPAPKNTPLALGPNTHYFRKSFQWDGPNHPANLTLQLRHVVDDGAIFYLNGQRLDYAFNMNDGGAANYATPSAGTVTNATLVTTTIPASGLVNGTNVLAVEVHQVGAGSSDVVFGAELSTVVTLSPGSPFRESDEQWVELYNRSAAPVDVSGWRLDEAVDYTIPAVTSIPAGGYLVIAKDAAALRALHPTVPAARIIGNFSGNFSGNTDRVVLKDNRGNPADEVRYHDGGRWSEHADGGGPSLELRDPDADNTKPEAWAASDEGLRSQWKTYTYRGFSTASLGPDSQWRELVMGLLGPSEVLLDDIRVTDVATGTQLLQNGSFQSGAAGAWRINGTHQGTVVNDPTNAANKVLRLVATGAAEHYYNHAETTFAGGQSIVDGREYEISYKAKWIAGSNQLNTRLYFNRLPKTTILDVPAQNGTPGTQNTRRVANAGPTFDNLGHGAAATPGAGQPVTVSVTISDPDGGVAASLKWRTDPAAAFNSVPMTAGPGGVFTGTIPGQVASTVVQFYVEAADGLGATSMFPAAGPASRALYKVNDGQGGSGTPIHNVRIIMFASEANAMHDHTRVMNQAYSGATVVYTDREGEEVFYDVGARLKGSLYARASDAHVGYTLRFHAEQPFRGLFEQVALDRSSRSQAGSPAQEEIVVRHIINRAGLLGATYDDLARVIAPRSNLTSTTLLQMAREDSTEYLADQYQNGDEGSAYEFEVISWSNSTTDGQPESPKSFAGGPYFDTDIRNLGDDKELYRYIYQLGNNRDRDDFGRIMEVAKAFDLADTALAAQTRVLLDEDQWMSSFASQVLYGNLDSYGLGATHNLVLYVRPEDNKVLAFPHDMDYSWVRSTSDSLIGGSNVSKVIRLPNNLHYYYGHLMNMIDTSFNTAYLSRWVSHYSGLVGQNWSFINGYVDARANFVRSQMPAQAPFQVTTNNGENFTTPLGAVTIGGTGWVNVKKIFIQGRSQPLDVSWSDPTTWSALVPLSSGANALTFQAFDFQGRPIGTDSITVTSTVTTPSVAANLRITEVHYHPAEPPPGSPYGDNDFEFVELHNIGTQPLPIGGSKLLVGVEFTVPAGVTLAAGEYAVVVENAEAFRSRYGNGIRILGEYTDDLVNSGENIRLEGPVGETVLDFTYGDDDWYPSTDGPGRSLVIRNRLGATSNWNVQSGWRPSTALGGSPGAADPEGPATIAGRRVFYNRSMLDGNNVAANAADDAAVATDKVALLPGQTARFINYTSYSRGLNGIMVDIAGLPLNATLTAADFGFKTGNDNNPAGWAAAPPPVGISVRPGAGANGSDRVTILWADNAIRKTWLQVTVKATANTGLASEDVFYFGNAVGDSGNSTANATVTSADELAARSHPGSNVAVTNRWDFNRDRRVNSADQLVARNNKTTTANDLNLITVPAGGALRAGAARVATKPSAPSLFSATAISPGVLLSSPRTADELIDSDRIV